MKRSLRYYGDPILREVAEPIDEITDEIRKLVDDMIEIMQANDGIGLAAPQVGEKVRLFVACIELEDENGDVHIGAPRVYINPILSEPSSIMVERSEGCLSIPKLHGPVTRPFSITIEATNLKGERFIEKRERYAGRCMMHETDHLNGILWIDHVKGKQRTDMEPALRRIKQKYYKSI